MAEEQRHEYEGPDRRFPETEGQWHVEKKIPLAFVFAIAVQTVAITIAFQDVKRDVALNTAHITVLKMADAQAAADSKDSRDLAYQRYLILETKLDRLIERSIK